MGSNLGPNTRYPSEDLAAVLCILIKISWQFKLEYDSLVSRNS